MGYYGNHSDTPSIELDSRTKTPTGYRYKDSPRSVHDQEIRSDTGDRQQTHSTAIPHFPAELASESQVGYAVLAHCFTCNRKAPAAARVSKGLARLGIPTVRFDFAGLGQSDGEFHQTTFTANTLDVLDVVEWVERNFGPVRLLVGHSLGGSTVLRAAPSLPAVRAVATIASPFNPAHATSLFAQHLPEIDAHGAHEVELMGRRFCITRDMVDDLRSARPEEFIGAVRRPLLVMHSPDDTLVGIEHAHKIVAAAGGSTGTGGQSAIVRFAELTEADHLLTRPGSAAATAETIAQWFHNLNPS